LKNYGFLTYAKLATSPHWFDVNIINLVTKRVTKTFKPSFTSL